MRDLKAQDVVRKDEERRCQDKWTHLFWLTGIGTAHGGMVPVSCSWSWGFPSRASTWHCYISPRAGGTLIWYQCEILALNPASCWGSFPVQAWVTVLQRLMNRYGHLNVFVRYENRRMNWERLDRSAGLTHFTNEDTDRRRCRELSEVCMWLCCGQSQVAWFPALSTPQCWLTRD